MWLEKQISFTVSSRLLNHTWRWPVRPKHVVSKKKNDGWRVDDVAHRRHKSKTQRQLFTTLVVFSWLKYVCYMFSIHWEEIIFDSTVLYCFSDGLVKEALDGLREDCQSSRRVTPSSSSFEIYRLLKARLLIMTVFILPLWSELSPV
jgi:hypothetical protein